MRLQLVNDEISGIAALSFFNSQGLRESVPHSILPFQIILFHAFIIITFTTLSDPSGTGLLQFPVDDPGDGVIMFVRLVAQPEHDVVQSLESVRAIGKLETLVGEVLQELNGVVGRFALSVGGDDEDRDGAFGKLVEVFKVVFLRVAYEGSETELGFCFFRDTYGVLFSGTGLRTVENHHSLFLKGGNLE